MKKLSAEFLFSTPFTYSSAPDKEQQATVKLFLNYSVKTYSIIPGNSGQKGFSFTDTSHKHALWLAVLKSIEQAIVFANKELALFNQEEKQTTSKFLTSEPAKNKNEEMDRFVKSICENLTIKNSANYPHFDFYMDGGYLMIEHDKKNGILWLRDDKIWSIFESGGLDYTETQEFTKALFTKHLKLKGVAITGQEKSMPDRLEQHLKYNKAKTKKKTA